STAWSPDSRRLAYAIDGRLHMVSLDGAADRVIRAAHEVAGTGVLSWSRDARSLAFQTSRGALGVLRNGPVRWIAANAEEFAWSPTGKWIAYVSRVRPGGPDALALVRPDGSGHRLL